MIPDSEVRSREEESQAPDVSDQEERNYFTKYLSDEANPFDKPVEEEENEDVFSGVGVKIFFFKALY